jgi:hypothetical protein
MDQQTAQWVLYAITVAAGVAWMAGLRFLVRSVRISQSGHSREISRFGEEPPPANVMVGTAEVEGMAESLSSKAASILAGDASRFGCVKIVERTNDCLRFEASPSATATPPAAQCLRGGQLRFTPVEHNRTRIDYGIDVSAGRGLLWGGAIFVVLGLIAVLVGYAAIQTWVVPNPHVAVRAQIFQMFQVAHFLWPPFLFGGIYRRQRSAVRKGFDALIHNLPYQEKGTA